MKYYSFICLLYSCFGAILSTLASIEIFILIIRKLFRLEDHITVKKIGVFNTVILYVCFLTLILFSIELLFAWHLNILTKQVTFYNRVLGKYCWAYLMMYAGNLVFPQLYWLRRLRYNLYITFAIVIFINIGQWMERFIIMITSLLDN